MQVWGGEAVVRGTGLAHKIFFILSLNFLLGELRKKNEMNIEELNLFFLNLPTHLS